MENCIFCRIVDGDLPVSTVFENDKVLAFMDISQVTLGHILVIPKTHVKDIFEAPPELTSSIFEFIPRIANGIKNSLNPKGINIVNNNGKFAGQEVFHLHFHLIPRYNENDGIKISWIPAQGVNISAIAEKIKEII